MANPFAGQSILSVDQFDRSMLDFLFGLTDRMREITKRDGGCHALDLKQLGLLFYQPSTRTRVSTEAAMKRLGGGVEVIENVQFSSVAKGESLPDTIRALECYCDIIGLRHPKIGAASVASQFCSKPLINCGDGTGEHPTQALLDMYTIRHELGTNDGLTVGMVGDLRYGRTIHSLVRLLTHYKDVDLILVSPDELRLPIRLLNEIRGRGLNVRETDNLEDSIGEMDVCYATRIQEEHMTPETYEKVKDAFLITPETMQLAKPGMILMHPLPRKTEVIWDSTGVYRIIQEGSIAYAVDSDKRAKYFDQMENGMYLRMALLVSILDCIDRLPTYED